MPTSPMLFKSLDAFAHMYLLMSNHFFFFISLKGEQVMGTLATLVLTLSSILALVVVRLHELSFNYSFFFS